MTAMKRPRALMSRRLHAMLIVAALGPMVQSGSTQDRGQPELQCRTFGSAGRLQQNEVFMAPLSHGLEFRLVPQGHDGWRIVVNPVAHQAVDYVWPVSPPYQTAPQLKAYNARHAQEWYQPE